jgi:quinohemoprotein ethanol dehydrogenase
MKEIVMKSRLAAALVVLVWSIAPAQAVDAPAAVDSARMSNADRDAANWLSYGRTYSEQRFMIKRANEDKVSGVK